MTAKYYLGDTVISFFILFSIGLSADHGMSTYFFHTESQKTGPKKTDTVNDFLDLFLR